MKALDVWIPSPEDTCILYQYEREIIMNHALLIICGSKCCRQNRLFIANTALLILGSFFFFPCPHFSNPLTKMTRSLICTTASTGWKTGVRINFMMFSAFTPLTQVKKFGWPLTFYNLLWNLPFTCSFGLVVSSFPMNRFFIFLSEKTYTPFFL